MLTTIYNQNDIHNVISCQDAKVKFQLGICNLYVIWNFFWYVNNI